MVEYRSIAAEEIEGLGDIDVSEDGSVVLKWVQGQVVAVPEEWRRPRWSDAYRERFKRELREHLDEGFAVIGAFDGTTLVGLAIFQPLLAPGRSCFLGLWVSASHRRCGVASGLADRIVELARQLGSSSIYVSACPSESAVGFYRSQGFQPTEDVHEEMYAREPEDIHMLLPLARSGTRR